MAKCAICGKGAHFGNNVSHSHRRTNRMWKANIKRVKVKVNFSEQGIPVAHAAGIFLQEDTVWKDA